MNNCPFPIGSIFITTSNQHPSTTRPGTYRTPFGKGKGIVCIDDTSSATRLKTPEQTFTPGWTTDSVAEGEGGSKTFVTNNSSHYGPSITAYVRKRIPETNTSTPQYINPFGEGGNEILPNVIIDESGEPQQPNPYSPII